MSDKPNVTVIYQDAPSRAPGPLAIVAELLAFVFFLGLVAVVASFWGLY